MRQQARIGGKALLEGVVSHCRAIGKAERIGQTR